MEACYKNSLALAQENNCKSIAFPLISAGVYGYPKEEALQVAVETIQKYAGDMDSTIVLFDREAYQLAQKNFKAFCD